MSHFWNTRITNNAQPIRLGVCVSLIDAVAAAAKAVAATVEEIAEAIAAGGWVALVILTMIIIIFVIITALVGYYNFNLAIASRGDCPMSYRFRHQWL